MVIINLGQFSTFKEIEFTKNVNSYGISLYLTILDKPKIDY
jgi:hypothetical protein